MVGQISTELAKGKLNIADLLNKSRGDLAYTLVDLDAPPPESAVAAIKGITGVLDVRQVAG